ncbi:MAG: aldehyde dehydrogenase family protein, partial [Gammaproteobacteria bacterium]
MSIETMNFLNELGIAEVNPGSCTGPGQWSGGTDAGVLSSYAPATGEIIAGVYESTVTDYEAVLERSRSAFHEWRQVPAPRRGQLIRRLGDALRAHQEAL